MECRLTKYNNMPYWMQMKQHVIFLSGFFYDNIDNIIENLYAIGENDNEI